MEKVRVGITIGDLNGIGLEVIIKSLANRKVLDYCIPAIYASAKIVSYHKNIVGPKEFAFQSLHDAQNLNLDKINIINCWSESVNIQLGTVTQESGKYAYISLDRALQDLKDGLVDVLVTAPIHKHAMSLAEFPYTGHTEYLADKFDANRTIMLMVSDQLKIGLVTNHIPVKDITEKLSKALIIQKAQIFHKTLIQDFGIERPVMAILSLNPHAGDEGLIGKEEQDIIKPAIIELKKKGMIVGGPFAADGFFGSKEYHKMDGILAMYHDQGLVAFKSLSFGEGVNFTAGLPIIRTSPDHGTGHAIAGKNSADPSSFRKALFLALDLYRHRKQYLEDHKNPLSKKELIEEDEDERPMEDEYIKPENAE
jgi:4-hydroxythreonine-4-phosphate dehydrogenase